VKSAIYTGWVQHRRFTPSENKFRYRLFMMYLDLAELPRVFDRFWFWSARRSALARFRREDYHGDPGKPLDAAVRDLVQEQTGSRPTGPIRMLTHLRYFGYIFNPVTFYYCFDSSDQRVETIVAEITNTPWDERHAYVLPVSIAEKAGAKAWRFQFGKDFHVSPFMPMDVQYDWRFTAPQDGLFVHMENHREGRPVFDATLNLHRRPITGASLARALIAFPAMTVQITALIYWQALKLILKRTPFFTHPKKVLDSVSDATSP
jgi:uncharacterized protein